MTADLRPRPGKPIQQFSFVDALVAGLLDGAFPASSVAAAGDLGLGCGDALDGELLLLDGQMFLCRDDGEVVPVAGDQLLPFAEVVRFEPTHTATIDAPLDKAGFESFIEELVPSDNLFYALRVDGVFGGMAVREAVRQQKPFRGLAEAVKDQHENARRASRGTMLGFKGPDVFQGLSVADLHLHYIDEARAFGGHVMDFVLESGTLSLEAFASFTVHLPEVVSYLQADLDDIDADAAIREAESS